MATTGYDDRVFVVEVSGLRQQSVLSTSHCTFKVSYRSLARTLQSVRRNGGTIVRIHALEAFPEQAPPSEQALSDRSATLDHPDAETIAAHPSPEAALQPRPSTEPLGASKPVPSTAVATTDESTSPPVPEARGAEPSILSKLISFFLEKLN